MDTDHRRGISHFDDQKAVFQGARSVKCGKSAADTVAVEVCPSTAPILLGKFLYTSLNKKDFSEALLCRLQPSVLTTKVQIRISQVSQFNACKYCDP